MSRVRLVPRPPRSAG